MTEAEGRDRQGNFKEGNTEGEKQWQTRRKKLLEKFGFDVEKWDNGELEIKT